MCPRFWSHYAEPSVRKDWRSELTSDRLADSAFVEGVGDLTDEVASRDDPDRCSLAIHDHKAMDRLPGHLINPRAIPVSRTRSARAIALALGT